MTALTLARWLNGFDAATENNFYNFSAADAICSSGLDTLRLGFEAGHNHGGELGEVVFGDEAGEGDLGAELLLACLRARNRTLRNALSCAFAGNASLFWSLHTSIWQDFKEPANQAMGCLLKLHTANEGEIDGPWRFVTNGWIDFSEE